MAAVCPTCGNEFAKLNPKHVFCRPECRTAVNRTTVERSCLHCGATFDVLAYELVNATGKRPATTGQFCGRACFYAAQRGTTRPVRRPPEERACNVCGNLFMVGGRTNRDRRQKACSRSCRDRSVYHSGSQANALSETEAAYLAGIIDGEGSVMIYERHGGAFVKLHVTNTSRRLLDWIAETTGVGKVHKHRPGDATHKPTMQWVCTAEAAATTLRQTLPYMVIKAAQADLALETQERLRQPALKADRSWQAGYIERMQTMNRRGPMTASSGG